MTDLPMHRRPDADLEAALRDLGATLAWPSATAGPGAPDVAAIVRQRIALRFFDSANATATTRADRCMAGLYLQP